MADTGVERVTVVRGKKTLLRVLAGLDDVTTGEVLIRGRRVTGVPSGRRRAAMVSLHLGLRSLLHAQAPPEVPGDVEERDQRVRLDRWR